MILFLQPWFILLSFIGHDWLFGVNINNEGGVIEVTGAYLE